MKNKNVRGIIALAVVTALSFGVIMGSKALAKDMGTGASNTAEEQVKEEIDTKGAEGIEKAVKTENGYMVTAKVKGYGGDIVMNVSFDAEKKKVTKVEVTEQKETEGLGAKVADAEFLSQFEGVEAPVFLPGMSLEKEEKVSYKNTVIILAAVASVIGGLLSLMASSHPDGLEWSIEKIAGSPELQASGTAYDIAEKIQGATALLPDYSFKGSESVLGTSFSGIIGGIAVVVLCILSCYLFNFFRGKSKNE